MKNASEHEVPEWRVLIKRPEGHTLAALYVRVSTVDHGQDVRVQEEPLMEWVERLGYQPVVFSEPGVSGAKTSRPVLDELVKRTRRREFAAVAVLKLDRLGRSLEHLLQLLAEFEANDVRLLVHDMSIDTNTPHGRLFFQIAGAFTEFERALIAERVKDGIAYAQRHGTKSGNPIGRKPLDRDIAAISDAFLKRMGKPGAITEVAAQFGVSRGWMYDHVIPVISEAQQRG